MRRLGETLSPLRERPFRLLWIGQTTSAVGDSMTPLALTFAVLGTTGSAGDLGLVLAAFTVAHAVFILAGGVWADRLERRLVMLVDRSRRDADRRRRGARRGASRRPPHPGGA